MMAAKRQRGFTLLELIVVLFIILMGFSAIAISISSGNDTAKLNAAARDIVSALRYAKGQALVSHKQTTVGFDIDNNSYAISTREQAYPIDPAISLTIVTAESELTGQSQGDIRFFPDGSCTGGRITLARGEVARQIDLNWLTGQITLENK